MRWFWLYRPQVPTPRAQAIQVVHMAHAMAARGHQVRLCVEPVEPTTAKAVLTYYGLEPVAGLDLVVLPASRTVGSWAFRARFAEWVLGGPTIVYARSKRYALEAHAWLGGRFDLYVESHEVDSLLAKERGENPDAIWAREGRVLDLAKGLVCNGAGTLALWEKEHKGRMPRRVAYSNAAAASDVRTPADAGEGALYAGSTLESKDIETLAKAAALTKTRVTVLGARPEERIRLGKMSEHKLTCLPPCRPTEVADQLVKARVLVVPLAKGVFGEHLANPLKLWTCQAVRRPIVGADLPTLHAAAPGAFHPYTPGDPASLAAAIDRVHGDEALRAALIAKGRVRTWADRAAEIEAFVQGGT